MRGRKSLADLRRLRREGRRAPGRGLQGRGPGARRYEASEQQPLLSVAVAIADALKISVGELAGKPSHRIKLSGHWWASWQTFRSGEEKIAFQQVEITQEGDLLQVATDGV